MLLAFRTALALSLGPSLSALRRIQQVALFGFLFLVQYPGRKGDVYNVLWVLVFGFATLNILGLVAKRFEPDRTRLTLGEVLAVLVVIMSISLLAGELLNLVHIFPIKLKPR